jgi:hypothetical protein
MAVESNRLSRKKETHSHLLHAWSTATLHPYLSAFRFPSFSFASIHPSKPLHSHPILCVSTLHPLHTALFFLPRITSSTSASTMSTNPGTYFFVFSCNAAHQRNHVDANSPCPFYFCHLFVGHTLGSRIACVVGCLCFSFALLSSRPLSSRFAYARKEKGRRRPFFATQNRTDQRPTRKGRGAVGQADQTDRQGTPTDRTNKTKKKKRVISFLL